jgi:predicted RNase H-like nuclease (RuvC/YqgF family)
VKYLSLILLCLLCVSCGSTKAHVDEVLISTNKLAVDIKKTSATLREETLPAVKETAKSTAQATESLEATMLEMQRLIVNLEPKLQGISSEVVSTLQELKALAQDARDLKHQLESEITMASDIRQKLSDQGNNVTMIMYVGILLGVVLIVLFIVIIHHKLTSSKRHSRQLDHMLANGGKEKILKALHSDLEDEFVEKTD